jgi:hypothetical protein
MKTAIQKQYEDGFLLSEQDVRRLYQIMVDAAEKVSPAAHQTEIHARLENGSIYELGSVDEVISADNTGQRSIEYLSICLLPTHHPDEQDWRLLIKFQRPRNRFHYITPISIQVEGTSRDWVVLAASELDERARIVRRTNLTRLFNKPYMPAILLIACIFLGALFLISFPKPTPAYAELERLYQAGKVLNPIEAMLILEKAKSSTARIDSFSMYVLALLIAALTLSLGIPKLAQWLSSPYVFYWGDGMIAHQRKRNFVFIVWTVVVLGVFVGVLSSYISKSLGL